MTLSYSDQKTFLHFLVRFGDELLASGAEVNRIEDTLTRIGYAYGAVNMNVFVITSSMVLTVEFPDDVRLTESRRILNPSGTDFSRLEELNEISRCICSAPVPVKELFALTETSPAPKEKLTIYLGSALAAGGFAVFFGGNFADGIVSALIALLICRLQFYFSSHSPNRMIFNLICSFLSGIFICLICEIFTGLHLDMIMIGDIMLLIPGIAMTNSVRDILVGDTISGILRLIESILWAGSLAVGFMLSIWLTGGFR